MQGAGWREQAGCLAHGVTLGVRRGCKPGCMGVHGVVHGGVHGGWGLSTLHGTTGLRFEGGEALASPRTSAITIDTSTLPKGISP